LDRRKAVGVIGIVLAAVAVVVVAIALGIGLSVVIMAGQISDDERAGRLSVGAYDERTR
jgi:hypothetical protein